MGPRCSSAETQVCHRSYIIAASLFTLRFHKRGLWFFVSFRIFFLENTRVRIFIFFVRRNANFFPEFNIRLYDKNYLTCVFLTVIILTQALPRHKFVTGATLLQLVCLHFAFTEVLEIVAESG
jgi:hypothetical protein